LTELAGNCLVAQWRSPMVVSMRIRMHGGVLTVRIP
jgi:hypothetical protein